MPHVGIVGDKLREIGRWREVGGKRNERRCKRGKENGWATEACYLATKCIVPVVTRDNTGFVMISPNHRTAAAADE